MPISHYLKGLRQRIGSDLLLGPSVTTIIYDEENRILLARHADNGVWVAPGGSIDPDESPADAAAREAWEETGLLVEPLHILGRRQWVTYDDIYCYVDDFEEIGRAFEELPSSTHHGLIGAAPSRMFDQRKIVDFAASWMNEHRSLL